MAIVLGSAAIHVLQVPQGFDFDEGWHLFFAEVRPTRAFIQELRTDTHPPLYYVVLRAAVALDDSSSFARAISVLFGLASLPWLYGLLRRIQVTELVALTICALAASAQIFVIQGLSLRNYSFANLWILAAFLSLLRPSPYRLRMSTTFLLLAAWTHYYALFALLPFLIVMTSSTSERRDRQQALGIGLALGVGLALYAWTSRTPPLTDHLAEFFPTEDEDLLTFFYCGFAGVFQSFLPWTSTRLATLSGLLILLTPIVLVGISPQRRDRFRWVCLPPVILLSLAFASWLEVYPFGGKARHQYVLFPFVFIALALGIDELGRRIRKRPLRLLLCVILASLGAILSWRSFETQPLGEFPTEPTWTEDWTTIANTLSPDDCLLLGTREFIGLYPGIRELGRLEHVDRTPMGGEPLDRFVLTTTSANRPLLRLRERWTLSLDELPLQDILEAAASWPGRLVAIVPNAPSEGSLVRLHHGVLVELSRK